MSFSLTKLLGMLRPTSPPAAVVIYTRPGCACCEKALQVLREAAARFPLAIEPREVDSDPAWREQYGDQVPVVFINGRQRFRGKVDPRLLERLLRKENGGSHAAAAAASAGPAFPADAHGAAAQPANDACRRPQPGEADQPGAARAAADRPS